MKIILLIFIFIMIVFFFVGLFKGKSFWGDDNMRFGAFSSESLLLSIILGILSYSWYINKILTLSITLGLIILSAYLVVM